MQMSEAVEVIQVAGAGNANIKLAEGWRLLAVVPGNVAATGHAIVLYVLGKPAAEPVPEPRVRTAAQAEALATAKRISLASLSSPAH